jgi:hypothetical protein
VKSISCGKGAGFKMTIRTRRILFSTAVAAFLAIGFVLIMYAQGYRWDFENNKLVLVGAIYVEPISPDETEIIVNNKSTDNKSASLIKNLLPSRKYQVKVAKADYQSWEKEFEVDPGFVVNAQNIILFPETLKTQIILPDPLANDFSPSPNQKIIAVVSGNSKLSINNYSGDTVASVPIIFADKKKTISVGILKNNKSWSENSKKLVFWREIAPSGRQRTSITNWYAWDSENESLIDLTNLYEKKIVLKQASSTPLPTKFVPNKILWFGNDNNLLVLMNGNIFEIDIKNESVRDLNLSDVMDFDSFENKIIALKNPDILMLMESAVQNVSALGQTKFQAQRVIFSPDGNKIAYANGNAIGVVWLKDTDKQPFKKSGEQETIYQGSGYVSQIYWHKEGEYIIFLEDTKLNAVELDKRGKMNVASWPETISTISYIPKDLKLFILEGGSIKSVEGEF